MKPKELTINEINALLLPNQTGKYEPRGLFYCFNGKTVTGVDNRTGEAWTEDFATLEECIAWLET